MSMMPQNGMMGDKLPFVNPQMAQMNQMMAPQNMMNPQMMQTNMRMASQNGQMMPPQMNRQMPIGGMQPQMPQQMRNMMGRNNGFAPQMMEKKQPVINTQPYFAELHTPEPTPQMNQGPNQFSQQGMNSNMPPRMRLNSHQSVQQQRPIQNGNQMMPMMRYPAQKRLNQTALASNVAGTTNPQSANQSQTQQQSYNPMGSVSGRGFMQMPQQGKMNMGFFQSQKFNTR